VTSSLTISALDRDILRRLAGRVAEAAHDPVMAERERLWRLEASLRPERPMVLAETMGLVLELYPESSLTCQTPQTRALERQLTDTVFRYEHVADDWVISPWFDLPWQIDLGDWGVPVNKISGDNEGHLASYVWDPPIKDLDRDMAKLHHRHFSVDREATLAQKQALNTLFGDLLPVRIRGAAYWTMGLTWRAIDLIGMEKLMLAMYDNPDGLRALLAFLRDDHMALVDWLEKEHLYTLNNEADYVGSGAIGYCDELPQADWSEGDPVRASDLWVLSESQETVGVSPKLFAEFILPYQLPLIERFGLCYYGCCEPIHARWPYLKDIPNLRRLSISPWCDQAYMAEALGSDFIFCRKPNPALISRTVWDEEAIRADIAETLETTRGCVLEFAMKDVHTLAGENWRLGRWVEIAREEIDRLFG